MNSIRLKSLELSTDLLEPWLDYFTDNQVHQVLKDVPVLGSAVKVALLGKTITDGIFLHKVKRFLEAIHPATVTDAGKFAEELENKDRDAVRTAEFLLLALDSMNDLEKAPILAALFTALLKGEMSKADFRRITAAVNSTVVDDLQALASLGPNPKGSSKAYVAVIDGLRHTGLTGEPRDVVVASTDVDLAEAVTPLGKIFSRALARFGAATGTEM